MEKTEHTNSVAVEALLQRIDTMMRELQEMRRLILAQSQPSEADLIEQLHGAFAPQTRHTSADVSSEWEREDDE